MDWPTLIRAGLRELRLTPAQFWALTPAELGIMLGLDQIEAPMGRSKLQDLINAFPDVKKEEQNG